MQLPLVLCPCGSKVSFTQCCQIYLREYNAPTPLLLMRSRYCAFVQRDADYLIATSAAASHAQDERVRLEHTFSQTRWLGLSVLAASADTVEFIAFYCDVGSPAKIAQLHEKSYFSWTGTQWIYQSGQQLPPVKLQRNDTCFCGSGKKFKKCHGVGAG